MLVQLSDPHVVAPGRLLMNRIDTPALLAQAVAAVAALRPLPQAVVLTGDLVEHGLAEEYAHLRTLLAPLTMPVWLMPGNHDDVGELRRAFADHDELAPASDPALAPFVLWVRDLPGLRLVALDTVVPRSSAGALCDRRLAWLDHTLALAPQRPTVLALHHPPFACGIGHMDAIALRGGLDGLDAVLRRHGQVERVVCGHLHRPVMRRFGGTLAMSVPSTAHQIAFDLRDGAPAAWRHETPGLAVHLPQDGALVSHWLSLGPQGPVSCYA